MMIITMVFLTAYVYPLAIPNEMGSKATELYYKAQTVHNIKDSSPSQHSETMLALFIKRNNY